MKLIDTKEQDVRSWDEIIAHINWRKIFLCVITFFIARVQFFDVFLTFVVAYVGALYSDYRLSKWAGLMGILGILSIGKLDIMTLEYILIILSIMVGRGTMKFIGIKYNERNQAIITGISVFIISMLSNLITEITTYNIIISVLEASIAVGGVMILSHSIKVISETRTTPLTQEEMASMGILIAGLIGGMIDFSVVVPIVDSIYFKDILVFILMIIVTMLGGLSSGIIITLVVSTVLVMIGYMPTQFMGIYLFASLSAGVFCFLDKIGVVCGMTLGLILGFAIFNNKIIDANIMGAYGVAAILSVCIPRHCFGMSEWFGYGIERDEEKHLQHVQTILTERLVSFSTAFEKLSKTFEKISDKEVSITQQDINAIIEDTGECICSKCNMRNFCWNDYIKDTYNHSYSIINTIEKKGTVSVGDIPPKFKGSCIQAENFAFTLGLKLDLFKANMQWQKRFAETRGLISEQFYSVAQSIDKLSKDIKSEVYFNKQDEQKIRERLHKYGIRTKDIMVLERGGRKQEIHIYVCYKGEQHLKERLAKTTSAALDLEVEVLKYQYNLEEKYAYFKLGIKKKFKVTSCVANSAKNDVCGDEHSFMELANGQYLLALADGMGSGENAHKESSATIELLEGLMDAGFDNDLAVKMINSILVLKSETENFSTMDITIIDEYSGIAEFIKLGASTTFLIREDEITSIKASSFPIGILKEVDTATSKQQLKDGDILIMVTDGILESKVQYGGREETFKHLIREAKSNNPKYLAEHLLNKAKNLLACEEEDDMTIIVARIWK